MLKPSIVLMLVALLCACGEREAADPAATAVGPVSEAPTTTPVEALQQVPRDPHSYSEPHRLASRHLELDLVVDFERRQLAGTATLQVERLDDSAETLLLDTRDLHIDRVELAAGDGGSWRPTTFSVQGRDPVKGSALNIAFPKPADRVRVHYRTSPDASGLQWLDAEQTADRQAPFLFSQSQAIHARSWIPLQDTPLIRITYAARIRTPDGVRALMSADNDPQAPIDGTYAFSMPQPIPSYLMAIAAGRVEFRALGERVGVYAEPSVVAAAAEEFEDTPAMLHKAEALYGPYRWGRYDLLILPPSFPYGGMENPRLTFATPTVIAGDKSLVALVAHELAHSWSGNLVTNATWRDFWLNEGFTTYFTYRIMEAVFGEARSEMEQLLDYNALQRALDEQPAERTALAPRMPREEPGDYVSEIVYNKGALFLKNLEKRFGREAFDPFLSRWFEQHAFTTQTTEDFVAFLQRELMATPGGMDEDTMHAWIYAPGLPEDTLLPESPVFAAIDAQRQAWLDGEMPASALDTAGWTVLHWQHFLDELPEDVTLEQLGELDAAFDLSQTPNAVLAKSWFLQTIPAGYAPATPAIERHLQTIGRMYLIVPVYRALVAREDGRGFARRVYDEARAGYHPITRSAVEAVLNPES